MQNQDYFIVYLTFKLFNKIKSPFQGAAWTISFLLEKIISNLTAMNSEPSVVQDTVNLLVALVDSKERGRQVRKY